MNGRPFPRALRVLAAAAALAALCGACRRERPRQDQSVAPPPASSVSMDPATQMTIGVTGVRADPSIDPEDVRKTLRDAEAALLSCVDADGSTGVVVMRIGIERGGFVGDLALSGATTYGSDEARSCLRRIVGAMRFGSYASARTDVEVTLEVRTRFAK